MSELSDRILISNVRETGVARFRRWAFVAVPLAAILFQVYVPLFFQFLGYLEMPLLVTIYFALMQRDQIRGTFIGAGIGLVQDSLSHQPVGMYGIVKTMVGYFAASVGMRFDVDHSAMRFLLCLLFVCFHQFFAWVMASALLGQQVRFDIQQTFFIGLLNAAVAIFLFRFLDKLRERA